MGGDHRGFINWQPPANPDFVPPPKLPRPRFSIICMILDLFIPYIMVIITYYGITGDFSAQPILLLSLCYLALRTKRILLWLILLYQRFAPEDLRNSCTYTPSCSEYMYLSINKYGVLPGLVKGIDRLFRCRGSHNGEDYP